MTAPSSFPNGFSHGVSIRGLPILNSYPGQVFYVSSVVGSDGNRGSFERPFATLDYAVGKCTASKGDLIILMPGHSEAVTSAGAIAIDVAGVTIISQGKGDIRPRFTFSGATTASITITAANVSFEGAELVCSLEDMANPLDITGDGCYIDLRGRDASGTAEAARYVLLTGVDRGIIKLKHNGITGGNGCVNSIRLVGCTDIRIETDFYGKASTGVVEFLTTASTNVNVRGYMYNSGTTDFSKAVVDTVTGSTWTADFFDGAAGVPASGGSGAALASYSVSSVSSALTTLQAQVSGAAGIASFPTGAAAANAVSLAEVLRYLQENVIIGTGTALPADSSLFGVLAGATGVATFPAAAAAANGVSLAEVIRYEQNLLALLTENRNADNYLSITADMTSATWNTAAAHEILTVTGACRIKILPQIGGTLTSAGSAATLVLGDETTTNSLITSTDAENLATAEWWFDATDTRTVAIQTVAEKLDFRVAGGKDIGYTIGTEALTGGSIIFHVWWVPIDATGAVAAGAGGVL